MNFSKRITVAKSISKANATLTTMKLIEGEISKVHIFFPEGHAGLSYCQIFDGEIQIFPTNLGESYSAVGENFETAYKIVRPWELKIKTWNLDTKYSHDIIVRISLKTKESLSKEMIIQKRDDGFLGAIINFFRSIFDGKRI